MALILVIKAIRQYDLRDVIHLLKLHILEQGGHCSYIENADNYNMAVLRFLRQLV